MKTDSKTLSTVDRHARRYSVARSRLSRRYAAFQRALQALQQKHLPKIKVALDEAANVKSNLEISILAAPGLFAEPRTLTLHGVRVGLMSGKAVVALPKAAAKRAELVSTLKGAFTPAEIAEKKLVVTVEQPSGDALLALFQANEKLAIAGVTYVPAGDRVFIKPADHAIDKVIMKLLQEGLQKGAADEAAADEEEAAA